jgi:hypothetical protein
MNELLDCVTTKKGKKKNCYVFCQLTALLVRVFSANFALLRGLGGRPACIVVKKKLKKLKKVLISHRLINYWRTHRLMPLARRP